VHGRHLEPDRSVQVTLPSGSPTSEPRATRPHRSGPTSTLEISVGLSNALQSGSASAGRRRCGWITTTSTTTGRRSKRMPGPSRSAKAAGGAAGAGMRNEPLLFVTGRSRPFCPKNGDRRSGWQRICWPDSGGPHRSEFAIPEISKAPAITAGGLPLGTALHIRSKAPKVRPHRS
jgi:hypothetical protein